MRRLILAAVLVFCASSVQAQQLWNRCILTSSGQTTVLSVIPACDSVYQVAGAAWYLTTTWERHPLSPWHDFAGQGDGNFFTGARSWDPTEHRLQAGVEYFLAIASTPCTPMQLVTGSLWPYCEQDFSRPGAPWKYEYRCGTTDVGQAQEWRAWSGVKALYR